MAEMIAAMAAPRLRSRRLRQQYCPPADAELTISSVSLELSTGLFLLLVIFAIAAQEFSSGIADIVDGDAGTQPTRYCFEFPSAKRTPFSIASHRLRLPCSCTGPIPGRSGGSGSGPGAGGSSLARIAFSGSSRAANG